jgi:uncharacterized protein (DUF4415 family)
MKEQHTKTAPGETAADPEAPLPTDKMERLRAAAAMPEEQIDTTDPDAPEVLDWSNAIRGRFYRPTKRLLTLRVDEDVIDWFKREAGGQGGYQTAMNRTLRVAMLRGLRQKQQHSATKRAKHPA